MNLLRPLRPTLPQPRARLRAKPRQPQPPRVLPLSLLRLLRLLLRAQALRQPLRCKPADMQVCRPVCRTAQASKAVSQVWYENVPADGQFLA